MFFASGVRPKRECEYSSPSLWRAEAAGAETDSPQGQSGMEAGGDGATKGSPRKRLADTALARGL